MQLSIHASNRVLTLYSGVISGVGKGIIGTRRGCRVRYIYLHELIVMRDSSLLVGSAPENFGAEGHCYQD